MTAQQRFETHDIFNQSPPYEDVDLFTSDRALRDAVQANGAAGESNALSDFGRRWGAAAMFDAARLANENIPKLKIFDTKGFRRDTVEFHPAYHGFMAESMKAGLHASTWTADGSRAAAPSEVARAARYFMVAQVENGHMCPITMTRACVGALAVEPSILQQTDRQDHIAHLRRKLPAVVGKGLDHARHGHDGETGRHRRAREHHDRACLRARATPSPGTNGSCRRRCATPSWCWHRRRAG